MHEMKEKMKTISEIKEKLVKWLNEEMEHGKEAVSTEEAGQVVDMIKDLADVEKNCWKAKYYESICCAMEEAEEGMEYPERMGYDRYRYPSSGRFAPKGSGRRYGYIPPYMMTEDPFWDDWMESDSGMMREPRMGYQGSGSTGRSGSTGGQGRGSSGSDGGRMGYTPMPEDSRYGRPYRQYKDARKHYTDTHSAEDEMEMTEHAKEHMKDTLESIRDIWDTAKPDLKKKMKADLGNLLNDLN